MTSMSSGLMPPVSVTVGQVRVMAGGDGARVRARLFKELPGSEGTGSGVHFKRFLAKSVRLTFWKRDLASHPPSHRSQLDTESKGPRGTASSLGLLASRAPACPEGHSGSFSAQTRPWLYPF